MKQVSRWIGILVLTLLISGACAAESSLDISSSQKDQLKALASNTRDRTARERDSLRQARAELVRIYSSYKIDWGKLKTTWTKTSSAQVSLLNIHLDNEIAIREILKPEQFKKLREMMKRRVRDRDVFVVAPPEIEILDRLPDKAMLESLGVPDEKQKQLDGLGTGKTIQELKESSKELLKLYSNYSLDSADARKLINVVHQKQATLLKQQNQRQRLIRQILTPEQFQKLQQEIAKKMAQRGSRPSKWGHGSRPKSK